MTIDTLSTIGEIADRLQEPPSRISYIVSKFRMKAVRRIGIIRMFDESQIEAIRQGLYGMQIHETRR